MRVRRATFVGTCAVAYVAALAAACDSESFYGTGGGAGFVPGGTGRFDSGAGTRPVTPSPCDEAAPGDTCEYATSVAPQECELGDAANIACNVILTCNTYEWRLADAIAPSCDGVCPVAFTPEAPDGACEGAGAPSLLCAYPEGTCGCARVSRIDAGVIADAGDDLDGGDADVDDAGEDAASGEDAGAYAWTCIQANRAAGCPRERPSLGSRCVRDMRCDYGACLFDNGIAVRCRGGKTATWERDKTAASGCR